MNRKVCMDVPKIIPALLVAASLCGLSQTQAAVPARPDLGDADRGVNMAADADGAETACPRLRAG
jgi:hypothetical protein